MDVKLGTLLAVLGLTAVAAIVAQILPPAKELVALALLLDVVPFGGVAVATVIAAVHFKRASVPLTRLLVATYSYFAGALVCTFGLAHLAAVIIAAFIRGQQQQFVYNFHFYSVVLLGVLLITVGFAATIEAERLARGQRAAWRASLLVWTTILAINLPLVPLQGFAVLFSVLGTLELLLLGGTRQFDIKPLKDTR